MPVRRRGENKIQTGIRQKKEAQKLGKKIEKKRKEEVEKAEAESQKTYRIKWESKSGVAYSANYTAKNEDDAVKEWKTSWKHITKKQIKSIDIIEDVK